MPADSERSKAVKHFWFKVAIDAGYVLACVLALAVTFGVLAAIISTIAKAEASMGGPTMPEALRHLNLPDGIAQDKTAQQHDERLRYEIEKEALRLQYTEFCAVVPAGPTEAQLMQAFQALPKEVQPAYAPFWQYMAAITQLRAERCHDDSH